MATFDINTGISSIAEFLKDGMDKIWPDPAERAKAELQLQQLDAQLAQGQMAINQVEAANSSLFVAGGRPFVMWVCGIAFAYHFIIQPAIAFWYAAHGMKIDMPTFDMSTLTAVLYGMLGLGSFRTVEKMGDKGHLPWQK